MKTILLLILAFGGQTPRTELAFEVATVKPSDPAATRSRYPSLRNGRFVAENFPLRKLLAVAYGLSAVRVIGPDWLDTVRFDIAAKSPDGVADTEMGAMLQRLLAERLHVATHFEERAVPSFDLTIQKNSLKLKPFDPGVRIVTPPNTGGSLLIGGFSLALLADVLAQSVEKPVVDRTGLEGRYLITLRYRSMTDMAPTSADVPDLFTALPEQLGLKLEPKKQPIQMLIVDSAERVPTAN